MLSRAGFDFRAPACTRKSTSARTSANHYENSNSIARPWETTETDAKPMKNAAKTLEMQCKSKARQSLETYYVPRLCIKSAHVQQMRAHVQQMRC